MKSILMPLLFLVAGVGGYGLSAGARDASPDCESDCCEISVECIEPGLCVITCYDEDGGVVCEQAIECHEPCDLPCEAPADATSETPVETPSAASCDAPASCCPR